MNNHPSHPNAGVLKVTPLRAADCDDAARVHRAVFPDTPSAELGIGYCREMFRLYATGGDAFGFGLWRDKEMTGFVVGGVTEIHQRITQQLRGAAARAGLIHPLTALRLATIRVSRSLNATVSKADKPPRPPLRDPATAKLFLIGITEAARGTGGAKLLLEAFVRSAFGRGFERVILGVDRDNPRARAAYEKFGFTPNDKGGESVEYFITNLTAH